MPLIDEIWKRIQLCEGQDFTKIRGGIFTYIVNQNHIKLNNTRQNISRVDFERALALVPLQNTAVINDLRGPSHIYAILMDNRIRQNDW